MPKLLQNSTDAELIRLAQNRQDDPTAGASAIGELYDRYHESIFRYIWSRVSDRQLAEDLTGDVFTSMVVNLPKYRLLGTPFQAWLYRIARNLIIDYRRKASSRRELQLDDVINSSAGEEDLPQVVEDQMIIEQVQTALGELKPLKQDVIILRFFVGLSLNEVASILGRTLSSVKVTQHRALKELRMKIESYAGEAK
jgi:RNA polymerase sigma-70 factor (ECF subfamily)